MNTLKYRGYTGTVEFDSDARIFHGHVIDLNDVITFQSQDATMLEEEFRISVDTYLELCEELGDEPEKPYSGKFNVRISSELHRLASVEAVKEGMSLNTFVAGAIEAAVERASIPDRATRDHLLAERRKLLAEQAERAQGMYEEDRDLADWEATPLN